MFAGLMLLCITPAAWIAPMPSAAREAKCYKDIFDKKGFEESKLERGGQVTY